MVEDRRVKKCILELKRNGCWYSLCTGPFALVHFVLTQLWSSSLYIWHFSYLRTESLFLVSKLNCTEIENVPVQNRPIQSENQPKEWVNTNDEGRRCVNWNWWRAKSSLFHHHSYHTRLLCARFFPMRLVAKLAKEKANVADPENAAKLRLQQLDWKDKFCTLRTICQSR